MSTTVIVTLTAEQAQTGVGLARTGHGASVPVRDVLANIGDARIFPVVLDNDPPTTGPPDSPGRSARRLFPDVKPIAAYGTAHRIFTDGQRLAMIARDQGCSFPGCTVGPQWTEAHHITEWQISRRTSVNDGTLLCGWHHREFEKLGWQATMINGIPHFIPPWWLDHDQRPRNATPHTTSQPPDLGGTRESYFLPPTMIDCRSVCAHAGGRATRRAGPASSAPPSGLEPETLRLTVECSAN